VLAHNKSANSLGADEKENNYISGNFFCRKCSSTRFLGNIDPTFERRCSTSVQKILKIHQPFSLIDEPPLYFITGKDCHHQN
jgi:hypothetical protein